MFTKGTAPEGDNGKLLKLETDLGVLAREVASLRAALHSHMASWDGADAAIRKVHEAEDLVRGFTEHIGAEVSNMRTWWPKRFVAIEERLELFDKMFRALGADMVVRATGGGSVAPPASKNK